MRDVIILTDRSNLAASLVRGEPAPLGVRLPAECVPGSRLALKVNLRVISGTAFAMWILRKVRSIPGSHRIEINGRIMPMQMPEAIDIIAEELVNARRPLDVAA
ncbi:hypothetical protein OVA24_11250 [Luteolibacter sp. SL250]|uniref:hypothetical protein n=1 Tax=Luteolibacter sp. SL250 TaxID=2995170 RepID=UPI00226D6FAF|nr:hypothetical protein [Luteolibacter sp. SL250]WAC17819.1 hypothetical protein OVA24_11250 [Luteolibacter sp. SL250]